MGAYELDELLLKLGIKGFYPLGYWLILWLVQGINMVAFMGNAIVVYPVQFECLDNVTIGNRTSEEVCSTCPPDSQWRYDVPKDHSLVADFDLVCSRSHLLGFTDVPFFAGTLIGSAGMGVAADWLGRRKVLLATTAAYLPVGILMFFVNSIELYFVMRFVLGLFYSAMLSAQSNDKTTKVIRTGMLTSTTFKAELFPSKYRYLSLTCDMGWVISNPFLPLFAFLIPKWRHLLGSLLSASILLLPFFYALPESVPWLIRKGRPKEAFAILSKVADARSLKIDEADFYARVAQDAGSPNKTKETAVGPASVRRRSGVGPAAVGETDAVNENGGNAVSLDPSFVGGDGTVKNYKKKPETSFWNALKRPTFFWSFSLTASQWSYTMMVYIISIFSYGSFGGHRLVVFLILILADLPGKLLSIPTVYFLKRRFALFWFTLLSATAFLIIGFIRFAFDDVDLELPGLRIAMYMIARLGIWFQYEFTQNFSQESIPTLFRARSYLIAVIFCAISAASGSFLVHLMITHAKIIEICLGIVGLLISFLAFCVPETKGEPLPQTLDDLLKMKRKTGSLCSLRDGENMNIEHTTAENLINS